MPSYRGHLIGGLIAGSLAIGALTSACMIQPTFYGCTEWLFICLLGSLFPDIDIKSKGQKVFYWLLFGIYLYLFNNGQYQEMCMLSFLALSPMLVRHRGLFHQWWFVIGFPSALCLMACHHYTSYQTMLYINTFFFIVGALSHLVLDFQFGKIIKKKK